MIGTIAAIGGLLLLLLWFLWPSQPPADRRPVARAGVDDEIELERAEREVQEAPDDETVRDWGPGVQKPRLP